jgi:Uncharacterized conserved protein
MKEVLQFLNDCKIFYIATVGPDGPKVRPFGFVMEDGGKLYFSTNSTKDVFKQLSADPRFEISATMPDGMTWIRLKGKAVFDKGKAIREKALGDGSPLSMIYETQDNPILELFYADEAEATIYSFTAEPRKIEL